ncbi:MAG: 4-(cytidine 5'-diphospho)-2-C-methyl-D-erythritol kinase [Alloprevotella sp.]|nr:4-(cytidine 5'-diphospho)-2-C-methyl-D-erythritol kinase [Alloprevotella sp.]
MLTTPCAKINLGLHVTERRSDGYHNIETVFYPIPLTDNLEVRELRNSAAPYLLQLAGNALEGSPADNLVIRALEELRPDFPQIPPLDIYLFKRIPSGAGLGGGSSDAAAMLRLLNDMFCLGMDNTEMERRAAHLGADCPFFIQGKPAYATGIGDILTPIPLSLRGWILVLVKPADSVSTAQAYAGITPKQPAQSLREAVERPVEEWRNSVTNDFESSVFPRYPRIAAIKETLYDMGATYAAMSGSGSCVYGLFRHRQSNAKDIFPDCFVHQAQLLQ